MGKADLLIEVSAAAPGNGDTPAVGPVYRNVLAKDGYSSVDGVKNLYDVFSRSVRQFGDSECIGWRPVEDGKAQPFEWLTYKQVSERATKVAGAMIESDTRQHGRCAVFGANCPEWMITMQVCR